MYEFSNPPSSWDAYLCTVPSSFTTTSFWSARELNEAAAIDPRVKKFTLTQRLHSLSHQAISECFSRLVFQFPEFSMGGNSLLLAKLGG
jgi:hypothetical protein